MSTHCIRTACCTCLANQYQLNDHTQYRLYCCESQTLFIVTESRRNRGTILHHIQFKCRMHYSNYHCIVWAAHPFPLCIASWDNIVHVQQHNQNQAFFVSILIFCHLSTVNSPCTQNLPRIGVLLWTQLRSEGSKTAHRTQSYSV